jgi:hypothetical protein
MLEIAISRSFLKDMEESTKLSSKTATDSSNSMTTGMQMTPFLTWMEKICKADEFVLSLQEIPEIVVGIEEVVDLDEEVAMAAAETHPAQKPITGLLLRTYQAAPRGRI